MTGFGAFPGYAYDQTETLNAETVGSPEGVEDELLTY